MAPVLLASKCGYATTPGALAPGGRANFSGVATVDFGDGTPPLPDVSFSVMATSGSLVLSLDSTTLPAAGLTGGGMTID
jgi:hypothetical protein